MVVCDIFKETLRIEPQTIRLDSETIHSESPINDFESRIDDLESRINDLRPPNGDSKIRFRCDGLALLQQCMNVDFNIRCLSLYI